MFYFLLTIFFILPFFGTLLQIMWQEDPVLTIFAFIVAGICMHFENKLK